MWQMRRAPHISMTRQSSSSHLFLQGISTSRFWAASHALQTGSNGGHPGRLAGEQAAIWRGGKMLHLGMQQAVARPAAASGRILLSSAAPLDNNSSTRTTPGHMTADDAPLLPYDLQLVDNSCTTRLAPLARQWTTRRSSRTTCSGRRVWDKLEWRGAPKKKHKKKKHQK